MLKTRQEVATEDRWKLEPFYSDESAWEKKFAALAPVAQNGPRWPALAAYKGTLNQGPQRLLEALDLSMEIERSLSSLYTYAHLRHDEDIANSPFKDMQGRIESALHAFSQETSWFTPEVLALSDETLEEYLKSPLLAPYRFHLEKLIRVKKHMLSPENEKLMALASQALQAPHKAFSAINDADFVFGTVVDSTGKERPLSHALYGMYIRDQDRVLRENTFKQYFTKYRSYENTLAELLSGQMQGHFFDARARHYSGCLEAALFPKNIPTAVYHALIKAVNEGLGALHRYMELRRKVQGLEQLHLYDIQVPLTGDLDIKMPYHEAEELIIESVAPLGTEYQDILRKGLKEQGWVDRYENKNKRSGAYSSGCFDSFPYILMNYKGILRDVFTLAHEAGHSMHSYYTHSHQPYPYGHYPIFLAEVASTFNEDLLTRLLLKKLTKRDEQVFLLNQKIEDIRGTLFRQVMFAEFELFIHEKVEQGVPLTPDFLKEAYRKLCLKYFGPSVVIDEEIDIEWARIPHFYYNFYVFQYATGISAALALAERVVKGGKREQTEYLNFLKSGCSRYPIETLKLAGIDMSSPAPVKAAIHKFEELVTELEKLLLKP